ncbi:hypothetical protein TSAR_013360 [Trichomalopsis sarcophagae]|uniref:Uncharacterized protein n=1 Tax=Trichomalopsis sarcophagae TaxID=543379 RepID=A0A232FD91_9HYME|nr:hypothetical protein TSAR_013360 [Trichomalopsis sarcophagae]
MSCKSLLILQIVTFVLLSCFFETGVSIKCFTCRSDSDPKCADPFNNSTIQIIDCQRESEISPTVRPNMCRKTRQKVNGVWQYYRGCAYANEHSREGDGKCLWKTDTDNVSVETCTCGDKYGCNSASEHHYNAFLRYGGLFTTFFIITSFLRP